VHHEIDRYRLAIRFDDARLDHRAVLDLLLAEKFEPFAGIPVEPGSVYGGNIATVGLRDAPLLVGRQLGPGRPDRQPRHERHVKRAEYDRFEPLVAASGS
jgi:hypothetical protein